MGYRHSLLAELRSRIRLSDLIGGRVRLVRRGREYVGLCPFHSEKTPSFTVVEDKRFFHCFGCGAHGDAIGFVMQAEGLGYAEAVEKLADEVGLARPKAIEVSRAYGDSRMPPAAAEVARPIWIPILPVPSDAPMLLRPNGRTIELINPKQAGTRKERTSYRPDAWWAYRDTEGRVLGYVLRMEFPKPNGLRGKWTPQITFCAGPAGARYWCVANFPDPRPLYGLAELNARPEAPVLVVEGEKTCDAGRRLFPGHVVVTWPGGSKGIAHINWLPLAGRETLLLPDADESGREAINGWTKGDEWVPGIAERIAPIAKRVRLVDPPRDLPEGWDLADAEGWSPAEAARWLMQQIRPDAIAITVAQPTTRQALRSLAHTRSLRPLDRRRLEGLIREIIEAGAAELERTLRWAAHQLGAAACNGEIGADVAEAVLVRAAARAGLAEIEARRTVASSFHMVMGGTE